MGNRGTGSVYTASSLLWSTFECTLPAQSGSRVPNLAAGQCSCPGASQAHGRPRSWEPWTHSETRCLGLPRKRGSKPGLPETPSSAPPGPRGVKQLLLPAVSAQKSDRTPLTCKSSSSFTSDQLLTKLSFSKARMGELSRTVSRRVRPEPARDRQTDCPSCPPGLQQGVLNASALGVTALAATLVQSGGWGAARGSRLENAIGCVSLQQSRDGSPPSRCKAQTFPEARGTAICGGVGPLQRCVCAAGLWAGQRL